MNHRLTHWRARAVVFLAGLVMVFLTIFIAVMEAHFRTVISERQELSAVHELELIGTLLREALLRNDYVIAEQFVASWGAAHPEVLHLHAHTANNFMLAEFNRPGEHTHSFSAQYTMHWEGRKLGGLEIVKDAQGLDERLHKLMLPLYLGSFAFTLILGTATWKILTHTAVEPLEQEIRHREKVEDDLREAKESAELANRAKSELQANMSHELRTPLNAIIGFSSSMQAEIFGPLNDKYKEYVDDINKSGTHLLALINDILDASAIEAGKLELGEEDIDINDVVASTLMMVTTRAAEGNVKLTTEINTQDHKLRADKRRVMQILLNLLSNAVKFTPPEGNVCVSADIDENGAYVLSIRDTGIGMSAPELAKAMSRFGQVDNHLNKKQDGTGIGLPLTKGLVELHGGVFEIKSEKGHGTTVIVTFPATRTVSAQNAA